MISVQNDLGPSEVHDTSLDLFPLMCLSPFNEQYRKCLRGPLEADAAAAAAAAAAATRAPRGAVSVPLPRTPRENILSNTTKTTVTQSEQGSEVASKRTHVWLRRLLRWFGS